MALPDKCPKCGKEQWPLGQVISEPELSFHGPSMWHRRTQCRWCRTYHEEIRNPGLWSITDRTSPIDPRGTNPFLED